MREGLNLSMVQKALLLGLGLQHNTVDDLVNELRLPANQVLALFNKAIRKIHKHLSNVVDKDTEQSIFKSRANRNAAARQAAGMTATGQTLADDMEEGAQDTFQRLNASAAKATAGAGVEAVANELADDAGLMQYAVQGADDDWGNALQPKKGGKGKVPGTIAIKTSRKPNANGVDGADASDGASVAHILAAAESEVGVSLCVCVPLCERNGR